MRRSNAPRLKSSRAARALLSDGLDCARRRRRGRFRVGAIWLGLALLVDEARKAFAARTRRSPGAESGAAHFALDIASATQLSRRACDRLVRARRARRSAGRRHAVRAAWPRTAFSARRGRLQAIARMRAVRGAVGLMFLVRRRRRGRSGLGRCVRVWSRPTCSRAALHHAHRAVARAHAGRRMGAPAQHELWRRRSAAWEIDFTRERLVGGTRLARLLGRPVDLSRRRRAGLLRRARGSRAGQGGLLPDARRGAPHRARARR